MDLPLPAHSTKHISLLQYHFQQISFQLSQQSDGVQNGTALWLGGQCLAMYLADVHTKFSRNGSTAIELGSGIGLTALALSSLGWDVLATDINHVIHTVLSKNITQNADALPRGTGKIQIRELDWTVDPGEWVWQNPVSVTSAAEQPADEPMLQPPFDLIFSADTVYSRDLATPLLRTLHGLSTASHFISGCHSVILLCVERRDPRLLNELLDEARQKWGFTVDRIPHGKLAKCIEKSGVNWTKEDWEGIEIWKLRLLSSRS